MYLYFSPHLEHTSLNKNLKVIVFSGLYREKSQLCLFLLTGRSLSPKYGGGVDI